MAGKLDKHAVGNRGGKPSPSGSGRAFPDGASLNMPIKAIAPWFGGKRNLAPRIVAELGEHRCYWEPFCGSMAVLMAKPKCAMETVNDLNGDLINLALVIRDPKLGPMLYRLLRRTLMHQELFEQAADAYKDRGRMFVVRDPDLGRSYEFFLCSWLGRNGVAGTQSYNQGFCARYSDNGGHGATRLARACNSIPAWRRRMRDITILARDGIELCERIADESGTVIYCDPPYIEKGATYIHDFQEADHDRLAEALVRFRKARVVVSYYEHPRLAELYPAWTKVSIEVSKALGNANMRGARGMKATEVLLINGPSFSSDNSPLFAGKDANEV